MNNQPVRFSSLGGVVPRWAVNGRQILFPLTEMMREDGSTKSRGGLFTCFPNYGPVDEKFDLPQHGTLRDTKVHGSLTQYQGLPVFYDGESRCWVEALLMQVKSRWHGFRYNLTVTPLRGAPYVNPGFHPYFATPAGRAELELDDGSVHTFTPPVKKPAVLPYSSTTVLYLENLATVRMRSQLPLHDANSIVVWSDSPGYLCVEPITGPPELYGSSTCPRLTERLNIDLSLEVVGGVAP